MADFSNIPTGLKITAQIPLDVKSFILNEATLSNLGVSNNLAFTYHDGLKVYCFEEGTTYIWREVKAGEENTGLVSSDFTYPSNLIVFGVDYSNKKYNFFPTDVTITLQNVGGQSQVYKNGTKYDLRTLFHSNLGNAGTSLIQGFTQNADTLELKSRLINSNSLSLSVDVNGQLNIELPSTSTVPGLYVNNNYIPSYADFQAGITKGNGSLGKPFTDTINYTNSTTYTITPNTAIQNALNAYVGSGSRLSPEKSGQKIIIQNNNSTYTFSGDFNYSNLNLLNQGTINCTTTDYLINMDNAANFNPQTSTVTITNELGAGIRVDGLGFLNSGNTINTTTYSTGRVINFKGEGSIYSTDAYASNTKYLINSDPLGTVNGTTGCNNDGNLAINIKDTGFYSAQNGIYKVGGKSRVEFNNCLISSNNAGETVNTNLLSFNQNGGIVRLFNCEIFAGGSTGRTAVFTFNPTTTFENFSYFIVRNTRFSGTATTWFKKTTNFKFNFDVISCNTLFFGGTNLFDSTNLWSVNFNNNVFEFINIDFTKVDFTQNNAKSSTNSIGNNIIEQLIRYGSREAAVIAGIPTGSAFLNTNGTPITTPLSSWKRDIVL